MNIRVYKEDVIDGLLKSASIIPARSGAAYLRSIWLKVDGGKLEVLATDSSIEFRGSYTAEVLEPGLVGVQGKDFVDLIRKLSPGQISLRQDSEAGGLIIEQGRRKYKWPTNDSLWFQNLSEFPESDSAEPVIWSGDYIQELIERINYCISDDDAMDAIACLSIKPTSEGKIEACGLNGHQFAMQCFMHDDLQAILPAGGILLQKKYLNELKKWLCENEVEISLGEKRLFFRSNDKKETFSLPLSSYQYPDYMGFLGKLSGEGVSSLTLDRKEILESLERLLLFNSESNRCTSFDFSRAASKEIVLSSTSQNAGSATEIIDGEYDGSLAKIAFPTRNLIELLSHYQSKSLKLVMSGGEGPCGIFGNDDPEYTVIIMPMKIFDQTYYSEEGA